MPEGKKKCIRAIKGMIGKKDTFYTTASLSLPDNSDTATSDMSTSKGNAKPYIKF